MRHNLILIKYKLKESEKKRVSFWHKQGGDTGLSGNEKKQKGHPRGRPFSFNTKYGLVYIYLNNFRIADIG